MTWTYKSPKLFPARYPAVLRSAAAYLNTPQLLWSGTPEQCSREAGDFRRFKWCIRQQPGADLALESLIARFTYRASTTLSYGVAAVYITASDPLASSLLALNPHLADLIQNE